MRSVNIEDVSLSKLSTLPSQPQPTSSTDDVSVRNLISYVKTGSADAVNRSEKATSTKGQTISMMPHSESSQCGDNVLEKALKQNKQSTDAHKDTSDELSVQDLPDDSSKDSSKDKWKCDDNVQYRNVSKSVISQTSEEYPAVFTIEPQADVVLSKPEMKDSVVHSGSKDSRIELPERYRHALTRSGSLGNVGCYGSSSSNSGNQDLTSREKDLGTALAWIRHEMVQMKEQDKVLLKRFIELRASILQLRCMYDVIGSASDLSMDGSCASLNEMRKSTRMRALIRTDSEAIMSSARNEDMYNPSSLSLPCSPQLSRLRWKTDDLM